MLFLWREREESFKNDFSRLMEFGCHNSAGVDGIPIKRYGYDMQPVALRPALKAVFAALAATTTSTTTTAHQGHYNDAEL